MAPYTGFSKSRCGSPGGHLLDELEEDMEAAAAIAALPVAPGPVALPQPPENNPVGFDMAALLHSIEGADLESVTSLKLRVLAHDASLQRLGLCLPCLQELTLDGSQLSSLRELGTGMTNLKILRVARCSLISLDGVAGLPSLSELHASHNSAVSDIWTCTSLYYLRVLDLSYSGVRNASFTGFLELCRKLQELSLLGSPAAISGQAYRTEVGRQLPNLKLLDGRPMSAFNSQDTHSAGAGGGTDESDIEEDIGEDSNTAELQFLQPTSVQNSTIRVRPASATITAPRRELSARRVMSARPRPNTGSFHAENNATGEEVPSTLTSGGVVCGSLVSALRRLRTHHCWSITTPPPHLQGNVEDAARNHPQPDELLDASRQWRQNYQNFRQENSGRWNEEDENTHEQQEAASQEELEE